MSFSLPNGLVASNQKQEKTVTAGTSAVVVTPDSGKLMSKVTVNPTPSETKTVTAGTVVTTVSSSSGKLLSSVTVQPTPSQSKTVTPGKSAKTVSPDSGKLLSKVTVNGDADLIAANIRSGKNIFGVTGTMKEGVTGIDFGTVTIASNTTVPITINHSLGIVPTWAALIPESATYVRGGSGYYASMNINGSGLQSGYDNIILTMEIECEKDASKLAFSMNVNFDPGKYYWFAIV